MRGLFSFFVILVPFLAPAQEEELVHWAAGQKLSWHDYKGRADRASGAAASTATYLGIDYNFSPKGLTYSITCSFSRNRSWGLHRTDYILSHEQGHFDIAEIFARRLNMKISAYRINRPTCKEDLKKIYGETVREKEEMQDAYDRETNHSINKEKQAEWLKKIEMLLLEYEAYAVYN
ncbi:MAG: DUF922 domain-containing protein [Chitinophagaceae bacterium]